MAVTDGTRTTVVEMAMKGATPEIISGETGISVAVVYRILKEEGLKAARKPHGIGKEESDAMCKKYAETQTPVSALLIEYGVTHQQLYVALAERSIPTRAWVAGDSVVRNGDVRKDRAVELYRQGVPIWKIEMDTGMRGPDIYKVLHVRGIALRGKGVSDEQT